MSLRPSQAHGFAARRAMRNPHEIRADWVKALALSQAVAKTADATLADPLAAGPDQGAGALARLMAALRDLRCENFPVGSWSAKQMSAAFLTLAQAFVRPEMAPEARRLCAGFLLAGACALDDLLTDLRTREAAASWRRQTGERDDD